MKALKIIGRRSLDCENKNRPITASLSKSIGPYDIKLKPVPTAAYTPTLLLCKLSVQYNTQAIIQQSVRPDDTIWYKDGPISRHEDDT